MTKNSQALAKKEAYLKKAAKRSKPTWSKLTHFMLCQEFASLLRPSSFTSEGPSNWESSLTQYHGCYCTRIQLPQQLSFIVLLHGYSSSGSGFSTENPLEEKRASEFAIRASGGLDLHNHGPQLLAERDQINPNATSEVVLLHEQLYFRK